MVKRGNGGMKENKPLWFIEYEKRVEVQLGRLADSLDHALTLLDERDKANKEAIKAAFMASEKASEKTELALKEYKIGADEWRDTVRDLINNLSKPDIRNDALAEQAAKDRSRSQWLITTALGLGMGALGFIIGLFGK